MVCVQERLEVAEPLVHLVRGRRDEGGIAEDASGTPDPVLRGAEVARHPLGAAAAAEELAVDLADEPQR